MYTNGDHWTVRHRNWMRTLDWDSPLLREVFDAYSTELQHCLQRLESLDRRVLALAQEDRYREAVGLLGCFYGIDTMTAFVFLTELFDLARFASPRQLMSYLGMTRCRPEPGPAEAGRKSTVGKSRWLRYWNKAIPCRKPPSVGRMGFGIRIFGRPGSGSGRPQRWQTTSRTRVRGQPPSRSFGEHTDPSRGT
jgi:hypothetical protein